jgi:histidinol-phosphate aminotransferase
MDFDHFSIFLETETPKLVFFTNPNNPTGVEFPRQSIFELANRFPRTCFVIDEAYVEFGENPLSVTEIPGNAIILRTFSKAFGLAGIRLGYSISTEELAVKIGLSKDNKEVDIFAQIMGEIAVKNPSYMFEYLESVERGRAALTSFFDSRGIPYLSGKGNFMLFKVEDPFEIDRLLKLSNVFIRNRTEVKNLKGYLRVTLGDEIIMKKFITLLHKII